MSGPRARPQQPPRRLTSSCLRQRRHQIRSRGPVPRETTSEPRVNERVEGIEVDFYWPDQNLVVEIDGPGHERPRTKAEDAARDRVLKAAGLTVVRIPSAHG